MGGTQSNTPCKQGKKNFRNVLYQDKINIIFAEKGGWAGAQGARVSEIELGISKGLKHKEGSKIGFC